MPFSGRLKFQYEQEYIPGYRFSSRFSPTYLLPPFLCKSRKTLRASFLEAGYDEKKPFAELKIQ